MIIFERSFQFMKQEGYTYQIYKNVDPTALLYSLTGRKWVLPYKVEQQ